jgi:hypothetical protein
MFLFLKEWFDKNESKYYNNAITMIESYIESYEKNHLLVKVEEKDKETMTHLLEDIYHDLIMRHSNRRKRATTFDIGVDLVNAGIALLPENFAGKT